MPPSGPSRFNTTHWSLIAALPDRGGTKDARARQALRHLCEAYWRPLYAFARHSGYSAEDAQDVTQAFLAKIIETGGLGGADPDRGRFRSYLLGAMKHFMSNARDHGRAKKRGGGKRFLVGDVSEMESWLAAANRPSTPDEVDRAFDRSWAYETTAAAIEQLEHDWSSRGKQDQFQALRPALAAELADRSAVAERLGMTENALNVAIHRLRQRYAALVREAVSRTVADPADIEDELRYLIEMLREK
ncbi:MAG: sigma-70 family RNA polymerase sigma factor [Planctomycetota bacterium]